MTTTPRHPRTPLSATTPATTPPEATVTLLPTTDADHDPRTAARAALKSRHSQSLSKLLEERDDLRGVHALADFVHDSVRWTA